MPMRGSDSRPVWLAALAMSYPVRWDWRSGRALYTHRGTAADCMDLLGVHLESGQTVSVSWGRGETAYTVEVLSS